MKWEDVDNITMRAKIHGGWLVRAWVSDDTWQQESVSICFVPDVLHIWTIEKEESE